MRFYAIRGRSFFVNCLRANQKRRGKTHAVFGNSQEAILFAVFCNMYFSSFFT